MEKYTNSGAATLSQIDSGLTDEVLLTALNNLPASLVTRVMPRAKVKGPTSQWIEPYYDGEKYELLTANVDVFNYDFNTALKVTNDAMIDTFRQYSEESFKSIVKSWALFNKNKLQTKKFIDILKTKFVGLPVTGVLPNLANASSQNDLVEVKKQIIKAYYDLKNELQLATSGLGIAGPNELAYMVDGLAQELGINTSTFFHKDLDKVYVFVTGEYNTLSRATFALFEYQDVTQKITNPFGDIAHVFLNRAAIMINPLHVKIPMVRVFDINP